ncbi:MAG: hypothetical protein LAP85_23265 [Acidobacteriia bacterium]|nr:hypothetical protein [Terriglobia bacterium]
MPGPCNRGIAGVPASPLQGSSIICALSQGLRPGLKTTAALPGLADANGYGRQRLAGANGYGRQRLAGANGYGRQRLRAPTAAEANGCGRQRLRGL